MISEILTSTLSKAGWELIKAMVSYFELKNYLSFFQDQINRKKIMEIQAYTKDRDYSGEKFFWEKVLTGQLVKGQRLKLFNFQVSPWFPRKPGTYWTYGAAIAREQALKLHVERAEDNLIVFDRWGKTLMTEIGGLGSVNLRKDRATVLFTLTASGHTDRGIPIVCPRKMWNQIENEMRAEGHIELDVRGTLTSLPLEYDSYLLRSPGLPKIVVSLDSIQNLKVSDLRIVTSPWALFETSDFDMPYGFVYVTHHLGRDDSRRPANWIRNYVEEHDGQAILTDFDEETNSLNAEFPLGSCMEGSITNQRIMAFCQRVERKFRRN
jgi:hypothetical protein